MNYKEVWHLKNDEAARTAKIVSWLTGDVDYFVYPPIKDCESEADDLDDGTG